MHLVGEQPLDLWYGIPLQELRSLLLAIPDDALRADPGAVFVVRSFFSPGPEIDLEDPGLVAAAAGDPKVQRWRAFAAAWRARERGDLIDSFEVLRSMPEVTSPVPLRVDQTGGIRSLFVTQAAQGAALAGEFAEALALCDKAVMMPVTPGLEFFARDAHLLAALIHGLYGDRHAATIHQTSARAIPRTASWIEGQLDIEDELVTAILAPDDDAPSAFETVLRLTYQPMGEVWPFYVAGLQRLALTSGHRQEARERIEALQATGLGQPGNEGFAGGVIGQVLSLDSLFRGNIPRAREEIASADPSQWRTQLVAALIAISSGAPRRAIHVLREMSDKTRGLRQADQRRILTLALAYSMDGDDDEAVSLLQSITGTIETTEHAMVAQLSTRLQTLAEARVDGWPRVAGEEEHRLLDVPRLTAGEMRVLAELGRGQNRSQIAQALFVSENTVKTHQRAVYRKLKVGTAEQAVREATRLGMI